MTMAFHDANLAQIELNKQEAAHKNIFVAGWRPFVGWICGIALAYHFILSPIIETILIASGITMDLPSFEFSQLSSILMGMLGLGGLRTYEKMKGVSRENELFRKTSYYGTSTKWHNATWWSIKSFK